MWIHTEHAMFVPTDDAVRDLSAGFRVPAGRVYSEQLRSRRHVLRHRSGVFTVLKHWRVVVDVQDGDRHQAHGRETWQTLVSGQSLQLICWLHLTVQGTFQGYYTGVLVNWEKSIRGVLQRVQDFAVNAWKKKKKKKSGFFHNTSPTPVSNDVMTIRLSIYWCAACTTTHILPIKLASKMLLSQLKLMGALKEILL